MGCSLEIVLCFGAQKDLRKFNIEKREYYYSNSNKFKTLFMLNVSTRNSYFLNHRKLTRDALEDYVNYMKSEVNFLVPETYSNFIYDPEANMKREKPGTSNKVVYSWTEESFLEELNEEGKKWRVIKLQEAINFYSNLLRIYNFYGLISIYE